MAQYINKQRLTRYRPLGIRAPIRNSAQDGVFDVTSTTLDRVKSSLYVLLFTAPGTRVQMPEFGSPIYNLQFEQVSEQDFEDIRTRIRKAVDRWVPEALIVDLGIEQRTESPNTFVINIRFSLRDNPKLQDDLVFTVR